VTKYTSSISSLLIFLDLELFWVFWDLLLFLSSFCHAFGGHDSLKKRKILTEIRGEGTGTRPDY